MFFSLFLIRLNRTSEYWVGFWRHVADDGEYSSSIQIRREHWVWVDGTPLDSTETVWQRDEPDPGDRCGILHNEGRLYGRNCEQLKPFICEKGYVYTQYIIRKLSAK